MLVLMVYFYLGSVEYVFFEGNVVRCSLFEKDGIFGVDFCSEEVRVIVDVFEVVFFVVVVGDSGVEFYIDQSIGEGNNYVDNLYEEGEIN